MLLVLSVPPHDFCVKLCHLIFQTFLHLAIVLSAILAMVAADVNRFRGFRGQGRRQGRRFGARRGFRGGLRQRTGRTGGGGDFGGQSSDVQATPGGIDFSNCETQDDGMCCVLKEESITTLEKDPVLECTHKQVEKCHYTYVTEFKPSQEEICEENFEKKCQITFKKMATMETVKKCYRPLVKTCGETEQSSQALPSYGAQPAYGSPAGNGFGGSRASGNNFGGSGAPRAGGNGGNGGEEQCKTFYESSCTTRYVEKQPGKFVGDTKCEKLPVELCGQGCSVEEGEEECHDKEVASTIDIPEEICDLNPQKTCRFQTKLVPQLKPTHECTTIPQEVCQLKFSTPRQVDKPLMTKWCIDPNAEVVSDETYEESNAIADVLPASAAPEYGAPAAPGYGSPSAPPPPPAPAPVAFPEADFAIAPQGGYQEPAPLPTPTPNQVPTLYDAPAPAPAPTYEEELPSYGSTQPQVLALPNYGRRQRSSGLAKSLPPLNNREQWRGFYGSNV